MENVVEQYVKNHEFTEVGKVPIWHKVTMSIREASEYSGIGINRIDRMLRDPRCSFVLFVGTKKLVKRVAFEEYLAETLEI